MKTRNILLIALFSFVSLSAQENTKPSSYINRFRVISGYSTLLQENRPMEAENIYININYRADNYDPLNQEFKLYWGFEAGLNVVSFQNTDLNFNYWIPYAKTGPELSLFPNFLIGGSIGIGATTEYELMPFPFVGINSFYFAPLNDNVSLEFEFGYHTPISLVAASKLFYFAVGLSFN